MLAHYGIRPWDLAPYRRSEVKRIVADLELRERATAALIRLAGPVEGEETAPRRKSTPQEIASFFGRHFGGSG